MPPEGHGILSQADTKQNDRMYDLEKDAFKLSWKDADQEGLASLVESVENRVAREG